ncbi:MAG: hypothetical protein ACI4Q4_01140 [Oscillospiraceae bacterium]
MSDKAENICLAVVLALLVLALGSWGIYRFTHKAEEQSSNDYSYALKGSPYSYPDVMCELTFDRELSAEEKEAVCAAVTEKMFENIDDDENHYLHYMDCIDADADNSIMLYIDFGCNDGEGLDVLLEFLDSVEGLKSVELS